LWHPARCDGAEIMPGEIIELVLASSAIILAYWIVLWLISLAIRDSSIGDPLYSFSMVAVAAYAYITCDGYAPRQNLILVLTVAWALRMLVYIGWRNWGREDPRYVRLRAHAASLGKNYAIYSLTHVFLSLGALSGCLIAFPLFLAQWSPAPADLGVLAKIGAMMAVIGIVLETVADIQLARFKRDAANANKVMDRGLWRYSRHPNYFGETLVWIGFTLIASESPWGWLAVVSPITLLYVLLGPLGLGLVERRMVKKRPEQFAEYAAKTSAFVPWFPKA
jgi:steroid 5-alpha reductase family enzyme